MQIFSFDIFDTVLFRVLGNPKDVFFVMQRELSCCDRDEVRRLSHAFHHIRTFSEFKARRVVSREDVRFDDIYDVIRSDFHLSSKSIRTIKKMELGTEDKYLVRNEWAYNYIRRVREFSDGVIFISDMYLPADFIRSLLEKNGLFKPGDRIYVSGDIGLTKSSGRLFEHVLKCEDIEPKMLRHMGDNRHSDYSIPRSLGIDADLIGFVDAAGRTARTEMHLERLRYLMAIMWAGMMTLRCRWAFMR